MRRPALRYIHACRRATSIDVLIRESGTCYSFVRKGQARWRTKRHGMRRKTVYALRRKPTMGHGLAEARG